MSVPSTTRPDAEEPRSRLAALAARPHVRQTTAEITARICVSLPVSAVTTAATGLATGAVLWIRHHRHH